MRVGRAAFRAFVLLVVVLLVGAFAAYFVQPYMEIFRFDELVEHLPTGALEEEVKKTLGAEQFRWEGTVKLQCISCYPCTPPKQRGVVLFYRRGLGCGFDFGWYLYFDAQGHLIEIEGAST